MYLPAQKYSKPTYTRGNEFVLSDGTTYVGWYFISYTGNTFTGKSPGKNSKQLTAVSNTGQYDISQGENIENIFVTDLVLPTKQDYIAGFFTRYFVQDRRNLNIIEVSEKNKTRVLQLPFIQYQDVKWILKGPAEDTKHGPYIHFGAINQNRQAIKEAEKTIKGLTSYIKYYNQFVI